MVDERRLAAEGSQTRTRRFARGSSEEEDRAESLKNRSIREPGGA